MRAALRRFIVVLVLGLFPLLVARSGLADNSVTVTVSEVDIVVPPPSGLVDAGPEKRDSFPVPPNNRLLVGYVLPEDLPFIGKNSVEAGAFRRYAMLQVPRRGEDHIFTAAEFSQIKAELAQNDLFNSVKDDVNSVLEELDTSGDNAAKIRLGTMKALGKFMNSDDAVGFLNLTPITLSTGGTSNTETIVGGAAFLRLKGKLIFAYLYRTYDGRESVEWVRDNAKSWVEAIFAANGGVSGRAKNKAAKRKAGARRN